MYRGGCALSAAALSHSSSKLTLWILCSIRMAHGRDSKVKKKLVLEYGQNEWPLIASSVYLGDWWAGPLAPTPLVPLLGVRWVKP